MKDSQCGRALSNEIPSFSKERPRFEAGTYTVKKGKRDVTYTKLSLGGKNVIISGQGEFGKRHMIAAGGVNIANLFYSVPIGRGTNG